MSVLQATMSPEKTALVSALAPRYLWWEPVGGEPHGLDRALAQIMNLGTYRDIQRLEERFSPDELAEIMRGAQPGWFNARSWEFWKGRLATSGMGSVPTRPPRRTF